MTKRAERVYLSFYEGDGDNAPRIARAIRQALKEANEFPENHRGMFIVYELSKIADELEDPYLLNGIYGNCYD